MAASDTLLKTGMVIENKWIIIEMIGKGAMGEVYRAHQINLKRDVAIKIVSDQMLRDMEENPQEIETATQRFQREMHSMAQVRHPNILNIFDYGVMTPEEGAEKTIEYIVMEYIPGETLRFTMSDDGLDDELLLYTEWIKKYFLPVLDGVEAMHANQIFHRDLKPENIFMDGERPKIADFGLARCRRLKAVSNSMDMKGTLLYMAPEQFSQFRKADQRADIYALGKILYEAVAGRLDENTLPLKQAGLNIEGKNVSPFLKEMDSIIQTATSEDKNRRFQSVGDLRDRLLKALDLQTAKPEVQQPAIAHLFNRHYRSIWTGIVIAILSVAGMTAWHLFGQAGGMAPDTKRLVTPEIAADPGVDLPDDVNNLKSVVIGRDGSHLILTGKLNVTSSEEKQRNGTGPLMYIDKNRISNYLYMEFLNEIRTRLSVDDMVVKHNGTILVYLGKADSEKKNIIYRHDRFHLKDQAAGILPVTGVTYAGASRYARYYGRSLLTQNEWKFAYQYHLERFSEKDKPVHREEPGSLGHMRHELIGSEPEKDTDRGLGGMASELKEWVTILKNKTSAASDASGDAAPYAGIISAEKVKAGEEADLRLKSEGFSDVGFRTKIPVQ